MLFGGILFLLLSAIVPGGHAAEFVSPAARATVTVNCPEGEVSCDDVDLELLRIPAGEVIHARGRTLHTLCRDGVTPCRFLGYEFIDGDTRIRLYESGVITIEGGDGGDILRETGEWR